MNILKRLIQITLLTLVFLGIKQTQIEAAYYNGVFTSSNLNFGPLTTEGQLKNAQDELLSIQKFAQGMSQGYGGSGRVYRDQQARLQRLDALIKEKQKFIKLLEEQKKQELIEQSSLGATQQAQREEAKLAAELDQQARDAIKKEAENNPSPEAKETGRSHRKALYTDGLNNDEEDDIFLQHRENLYQNIYRQINFILRLPDYDRTREQRIFLDEHRNLTQRISERIQHQFHDKAKDSSNKMLCENLFAIAHISRRTNAEEAFLRSHWDLAKELWRKRYSGIEDELIRILKKNISDRSREEISLLNKYPFAAYELEEIMIQQVNAYRRREAQHKYEREARIARQRAIQEEQERIDLIDFCKYIEEQERKVTPAYYYSESNYSTTNFATYYSSGATQYKNSDKTAEKKRQRLAAQKKKDDAAQKQAIKEIAAIKASRKKELEEIIKAQKKAAEKKTREKIKAQALKQKNHDKQTLQNLCNEYKEFSNQASKHGLKQKQERYLQRAKALTEVQKNPGIIADYSTTFNVYVRTQNEFTDAFKDRNGNAFDKQIHQELCHTVTTTADLVRDNPNNPYPETFAQAIYQFSAIAEQEHNPEVKAALTDYCHTMTQVAQGAVRITSKVASNLVSQKIEFVKGMLTSPLQTLRKEYLEPLQAAGTLLGKACYLACTDPERLKNGAVNRFNQTVKAAKNDPEAFMVAAGELLGGKTLKGITKIQNLQKIANAAGRGNQFAKVVSTTGKKAAEIKQAIAEPLKVAVEQATERIILCNKIGNPGILIGNGSELRKVDFFRGLQHSKTRHFLSDKYPSLKTLDPKGNSEKWMQHVIALAQQGEGTIKDIPTGKTMEIIGSMIKTGSNQNLSLGVRLFKPINSDTWRLATVLTEQK